ncbi:hypothetical protein JS44_00350 [Anoxybacillus flavithermus]|uniref:Uncharacterized protein n=1 Tax=Anoxybacillus flavithermus TaxID=33934 RepID=A0A094JJ67_9BACL|nr:hypothetical protein JS44_00350 [Anoxybacillus flavithermus]
MRNALKVALFILVFIGFLTITKDYWEGWLLGTFSLFVTLSVILFHSSSFRKPPSDKTLTWLVLFGSFPLIGFIFICSSGKIIARNDFSEKGATR